MTTRKFHKTTFTIEVLSEEPIDDFSLIDIHYAVTSGNCSGGTLIAEGVEIEGAECAKALLEQGSDPEFFMIDSDGYDLVEQGDTVLVLNLLNKTQFEATVDSINEDEDGSIYYTIIDQDDYVCDVTRDQILEIM
jgi:hypothetical protein